MNRIALVFGVWMVLSVGFWGCGEQRQSEIDELSTPIREVSGPTDSSEWREDELGRIEGLDGASPREIAFELTTLLANRKARGENLVKLVRTLDERFKIDCLEVCFVQRLTQSDRSER